MRRSPSPPLSRRWTWGAVGVLIAGLVLTTLFETWNRFSAQTPTSTVESSSSLSSDFALLPSSSSSSSFVEPILPITDVAWHSPEGSAVYFLLTHGVIQGYPDGTFRGGELVSRAELAKMLIIAGSIPLTHRENKGRFHDVAEGEWYTPFVLTAGAKGIVEGYPTQRILFKPSLSVNTAEFLKMLTRTFNLRESMPQSYGDVPGKIWYEPFAGVAWQYDLLPLRPATFLQPNRLLTRREVAIAIDLLFHQPQRRRLPQWTPPTVPVLAPVLLPPRSISSSPPPPPPASSSAPGSQSSTGPTGGATTGTTGTPTGGATGSQGTTGPFGGPTGGTTTGGTTGGPSSSMSINSSSMEGITGGPAGGTTGGQSSSMSMGQSSMGGSTGGMPTGGGIGGQSSFFSITH